MKKQPGRRMQLHRALSKLGWGSRTLAWEWIRAGKVRVDGRIVTDPLTWIDLEQQKITQLGQEDGQTARLTIALHKPRGAVTTRKDELARGTIYDMLPAGLPWLFPVGRLDADSEGLLILTNDSQLSVRLTEPEHHVPKTYRVTIRGMPSEASVRTLRQGIELSDGQTRPAGVTVIGQRHGDTVVEMVLTEGKNRQIRRMWAAVGHKVVRLVRVGIGRFELGELPGGACRILDESEIRRLTQG